jgi:uncharacterized membrane protein YsdA (DUF1294 family)/cold shock CspA family protein
MKGRITEWNKERGFGYLESDRKRIFLHWRDFQERHKQPEPGDEILFTLGADKQGRTCAKTAIHANDGGRVRGWHLLLLAMLLALPTYAVTTEFSARIAGYIGGWCLLVSCFTAMMYAWDKQQARSKGWRESESQLHFMELIGGWPGAFLAQRRLRHKSSKGPYQFVFVLIVGLYQFLAIDAMRGWAFVLLITGAFRKVIHSG